MPKIFHDPENNLFFYIYTNDHKPAHVHVFKGKKNDNNIVEAKINMGTLEEQPHLIEVHPKMKHKDIIAALEIVIQHKKMFLQKWYEIHGN